MTMHSESDRVLEALHKGSVACSELVLALIGRVVRNHEGDAALSLNCEELLLEPGEHVAWVLALTPRVPVKTVAGLGVVRDHVSVVW